MWYRSFFVYSLSKTLSVCRSHCKAKRFDRIVRRFSSDIAYRLLNLTMKFSEGSQNVFNVLSTPLVCNRIISWLLSFAQYVRPKSIDLQMNIAYGSLLREKVFFLWSITCFLAMEGQLSIGHIMTVGSNMLNSSPTSGPKTRRASGTALEYAHSVGKV